MWESYNYEGFNPQEMFSGNTTHTGEEGLKFNLQEILNNAKIIIKFKNNSNNPDPIYAHEGDSGFDLRAYIPLEDNVTKRTIIIPPMGRKLISTGLFFELPESYELQIRSRSGLAVKHGIGVLTGTVDNAYRGEVHVLLINLGDEPFKIENGDRIAQGIIVPRLSTEFGLLVKVDNINETKRGDGGFGSTGKK
jgi:dUTP pyrophosphatase